MLLTLCLHHHCTVEDLWCFLLQQLFPLLVFLTVELMFVALCTSRRFLKNEDDDAMCLLMRTVCWRESTTDVCTVFTVVFCVQSHNVNRYKTRHFLLIARSTSMALEETDVYVAAVSLI